MNFGHFGALPRLRPSTMSRTMEVGAQKESQGELPGNEEQHTEENQDKQNQTTKKNTGGTNNTVRDFW